MPTSKKERIIFTTFMCFFMVLGMSSYNLLIHNHFSLRELSKGLLTGFVLALLLDVFVVGIYAKKIVFRLPIKLEQPLYLIITISSLMVLGMVTFMSIFGLVIESGTYSWNAYLQAWKMNFIVALPYQLLIVGPLSRFVLAKLQARTQKTTAK
ncbi:DUF2798 domain-containing protein [Enterococcus faecalis]